MIGFKADGALPRLVYKEGHYGVSLLAYAPVGATLALAGLEGYAVAGGAIVLGLATLPDVDHRLPLVAHRGATHTLAFALLVGAVLAGGGWALGSATGSGRALSLAALGFGTGVLGIVAHLVGDVVTPMGIRPFRPVSDRHYTLSLTRADNTLANWLLLGAGVGVTAALASLLLGGY